MESNPGPATVLIITSCCPYLNRENKAGMHHTAEPAETLSSCVFLLRGSDPSGDQHGSSVCLCQMKLDLQLELFSFGEADFVTFRQTPLDVLSALRKVKQSPGCSNTFQNRMDMASSVSKKCILNEKTSDSFQMVVLRLPFGNRNKTCSAAQCY